MLPSMRQAKTRTMGTGETATLYIGLARWGSAFCDDGCRCVHSFAENARNLHSQRDS